MPSVYTGLVPRRHRTAGLPQDSGLLEINGQMTGAIPSDASCPGNQIVDAITLGCVNGCPDDSRPVNGKCVGYSGPAVGPGYMIIAGHAIPKWMLYAAGGLAATLVALLIWHHPASSKVVAKAASFLR